MIESAVADKGSPLWFPQLSGALARGELDRLCEGYEIAESDYGTLRVVMGDKRGERNVPLELALTAERQQHRIMIEVLPDRMIEKYRSVGVEFYTGAELACPKGSRVAKQLRVALSIIRRLPSLYLTVLHLVRSVHIIAPQSHDYDVSFSEPDIPFSIFVSVPSEASEKVPIRLAEAIVHEAMHLQLTLIERSHPLLKGGGEELFSPWKSEVRPLSGVVHGLYVFGVLDEVFSELIRSPLPGPPPRDHLEERIRTIRGQTRAVESVRTSPSLTPIGEELISRLLKS